MTLLPGLNNWLIIIIVPKVLEKTTVFQITAYLGRFNVFCQVYLDLDRAIASVELVDTISEGFHFWFKISLSKQVGEESRNVSSRNLLVKTYISLYNKEFCYFISSTFFLSAESDFFCNPLNFIVLSNSIVLAFT
mgnify:CR=1 FL=1